MDSLGIAIFFSIFATINVASNLMLVLLTWKSKQLRTPCNFLIATEALLEALFSLGAYPQRWLFPVLWSTIPLSKCFLVLIVPFFVIESATVMPVLIAVERFLNVFFPIWAQQQRNSKRYPFLMTLPAFIYGLAMTLFLALRVCTIAPNRPVSCTTGDVYSSDIGSFSTDKGVGVVAFCWAVYLSIWLRMKLRRRTTTSRNTANLNADENFRRLSCSLVVVTVLVTVAWVPVPIASLVFGLLQASPETVGRLFPYVSIVALTVPFSLMLPVLYYFSKEYRNAVNELFARWKANIRVSNNNVVPIRKSTGHPQNVNSKALDIRIQSRV